MRDRLLFVPAVELFLLVLACVQVFVMLRTYTLPAFLLGASTASANYWSGWHGRGNPWQWPGPNPGAGGFWLEQTQDVIDTLYNTYWNGSYYVEDVGSLKTPS